jgi:hypothetical protein
MAQKSLLDNTPSRIMIPHERLQEITMTLPTIAQNIQQTIQRTQLARPNNAPATDNQPPPLTSASGEVPLPAHAPSPSSQNNNGGQMGPPGLNRPVQAPIVAPQTKPVPPAVAPSPAPISAHTPVASASTPAQTPPAASPPVPKSPIKGPARPKPGQNAKRNNKASKANQPPTPVAL